MTHPGLMVMLTLVPAACGGLQGLPPDFDRHAAEAPEATPIRLLADGDRLVGTAVPLGPGGLPAEVRLRDQAIQPGGETVFQGREWGPRGEGYRIDKRYREGAEEHHRSLLVTAAGEVLERSHSLPLKQVPQPVLLSVLRDGRRDVTRADVLSDSSSELGYRLWATDRLGRHFLVECDLDGDLTSVWRIHDAELTHRVQ